MFARSLFPTDFTGVISLMESNNYKENSFVKTCSYWYVIGCNLTFVFILLKKKIKLHALCAFVECSQLLK